MSRRLAAILAADVVGYSRLMERDEAGTLAALKAHRMEFIDPLVAEYGGRVVKLMGDGALVEYPSVVDAVECSLKVQAGMARRNADIPEERRIVFRIGINLGDIIIDDEDIYGDGVNVAARVEALADPGGIAVSGYAHDHVAGKIDCVFEDAGEHNLKNIERPVRVYRVAGAATRPARQDLPSPLATDKPSIAVLPFLSLSEGVEQEYFADGITEDIITELSRFQSLSVIARNSSFAYKGRAVKVQEVARDLGVLYVLEGSVRKAANRVRVTAQLIEAETGSHVWAERYDRDMTDIFELQDELTQSIVATLFGRLENAITDRLRSKPPTDLNAYDCLMRAKLCHHRGSADDNAEAIRLLDTAIDLDPEFAAAYGWKICVTNQAWTRGYRPFEASELENLLGLLRKGIGVDPNDLECVRIQCEVHMEMSEFEDAERTSDKALSLNPNDPRIVAQRGELLTWLGRPEDALPWLERAMQLDPFNAEEWAHLMGRALYGVRRYNEALQAFRRVPRLTYGHHAFMAACCAWLDEARNASKWADAIRANKPDFSSGRFVDGLFYRRDDDKRHLLDGLLKAGLPD